MADSDVDWGAGSASIDDTVFAGTVAALASEGAAAVEEGLSSLVADVDGDTSVVVGTEAVLGGPYPLAIVF